MNKTLTESRKCYLMKTIVILWSPKKPIAKVVKRKGYKLPGERSASKSENHIMTNSELENGKQERFSQQY